MVIRRVFALLLINAVLAVPLCTLGCTPTLLTETGDRGPVQKSPCHDSSGSVAPGKDIPDSSPKSDAPCTHCAHLLNAIKRGDFSLLLSPTLSDLCELSQTSVAVRQPLEFKQYSLLHSSSPPRLISILRI